jgi:hypothetical protein
MEFYMVTCMLKVMLSVIELLLRISFRELVRQDGHFL